MLFKKLFSKSPPAPAPSPPVVRPMVNLDEARTRHVGPEVPSPCISVCQMNPETQLCSGCYRTLDEIGDWSVLDDQERLQIWTQVEARQTPGA